MSRLKFRVNFDPYPHQAAIMNCAKRHRVAVCHRRSGKTVMAIYEGLRTMMECRNPFPRVAYVAPYLKQAKKLAWDYLAQAASGGGRHFDINRSDLTVTFKPNGGKYMLLGADNIDAIRGIYLDLAIVDELADCDPRLWSSVLRYCLADRLGRALLMGTPRGRMNLLYDLSRVKPDDPDWQYFCYPHDTTGVLAASEIEEMRRDPNISEAMFAQEMECSFNAALIGAVYGREINELQRSGRYTVVEYDAALPVMTSWDLGWQDATAIIYWQRVGTELRVIWCEEFTLTALPEICRAVMAKPWAGNYLAHYGPHDLAVHEYGSGKSRAEIASQWGVTFEPTVGWGLEDGIEAARAILPHVWVSEQNASRFLECCANFKYVFDEDNRAFKTKPLHDWTSHVESALRTFAVAHDPALVMRQAPRRGRARRESQQWLF